MDHHRFDSRIFKLLDISTWRLAIAAVVNDAKYCHSPHFPARAIPTFGLGAM